MTRFRHNSVVFYEGPSQLAGGDPIVGVLSGLRLHSLNHKTGDLLQAWILLADDSPTEAIRTGRDAAVCGDCQLRGDGVHGRGCYVTYWQAPLNIWKTLARLPRLDPRDMPLRGRRIRLGAYGDPTAIPVDAWQALLRRAAGSIGYTQQWRVCDPRYREFLMASVLSTVDRDEARARGWRTYRVRGFRDPLLEGECICPASNEAGHKLTCETCMLCDGGTSGRANPVIIAHGKPGNYAAFGMTAPRTRRRGLTIPLTRI